MTETEPAKRQGNRVMMRMLLLLACFALHSPDYGQVLCVTCTDQNEPVNTGAGNLLANGGFEMGDCMGDICPNSQEYACDIPNWSCTGGGIETYAHVVTGALVPEGIQAVYFGNFFCYACSDLPDDTACIQPNGCTLAALPEGYPRSHATYGEGLGVSLSQTVAGLAVGETYVLEFWAGGESDFFYQDGIFAVDVGFGDTLLRCKPTANETSIGTRYEIVFIAASSTHQIKFTNWGHMSDVAAELILDDVRLFPDAEHSCLTGTGPTIQNMAFHLYPSPFTTSFTIDQEGVDPVVLTFYDISGRVLFREPFVRSLTVDNLALEPGVYYYQVRTATGVVHSGNVLRE